MTENTLCYGGMSANYYQECMRALKEHTTLSHMHVKISELKLIPNFPGGAVWLSDIDIVYKVPKHCNCSNAV